MNEKVAIVGFGENTRDLAPHDDLSFDVWGCNELGRYIPNKRFTLWFELHPLEDIQKVMPKAYKWLTKDRKEPILTHCRYDWLQDSKPYPFSRVIAAFPTLSPPKTRRSCYSSTIAWMYALAIVRGYKEIHLYGVDMTATTEYQYQKPNMHYFIGYADGKGIKTFVPIESLLFWVPWTYALEREPLEDTPLSESYLRSHLAELQKQKRRAQSETDVLEGTIIEARLSLERVRVRKQQMPEVEKRLPERQEGN